MKRLFNGLGIVIVVPFLLAVCLGWGLFCAVVLRGVNLQILEEAQNG